jgi:hypothetical protein
MKYLTPLVPITAAASLLFIVLLALGCSRTDTEESLQQMGTQLVGKAASEVIKLKGQPEQKAVLTFRTQSWGPIEILGEQLKDGERFEQWQYSFGELDLLIWFYPLDGASLPAVIGSGTHRRGVVYEGQN